MMNRIEQFQKLRKACFGANVFPNEVIDWIAQENYWNIWVPKTHRGLELSLTEGLEKLKTLAMVDGSLGWTITLCSGANYFVGNLAPEVANEIFKDAEVSPCFGGSGGLFGTAEKQGETYIISGEWKYATGAPYLTHFTLNAKIIENGKELLDSNGQPVFRSFVVPRSAVHIMDDWNTMGLKATASCSFKITNFVLHEKYSFVYNEFHLPQLIYKIPFSIFADLTLWVNYIGMAQSFFEESSNFLSKVRLENFEEILGKGEEMIFAFSQEIEERIKAEDYFSEEYIEEIHSKAADSVKQISWAIIEIYPFLGVKACREDHLLNQIYKDYFTATQHHIFTEHRGS